VAAPLSPAQPASGSSRVSFNSPSRIQ
jgi:hypothetical protein